MPLRLGPALFCFCAAATRATWLSTQMSGFTLTEAAYLLLAELPIIGILALLAVLERLTPRLWKLVPIALQATLLALYVIDLFTIVVLNTRLQLTDLYRYGQEWWLLPSFIDLRGILVGAAAVGSMLPRLCVSAGGTRLVATAALVLCSSLLWVPNERTPSHLLRYMTPPLLGDPQLWTVNAGPVRRYRTADIATYEREYHALFDVPFSRTGTSVIVVVVESLSAADSFRTSGVRDSLPQFDALSRRGMLFRNFRANCDASDCGIISLVSGVPPLHFPTASTDSFLEYAQQRSVVDTFARNGYQTAFVTSVPLQFVSMDTYLQSDSVGFRFVGGQHEIPRFAGAPRFGFESPADGVLYDELLARLDAFQRGGHAPVLMVAVTASSHLPYRDPLGRANSYENVWAYVQNQLWRLHDELARRGYFERGLLVITGDHRRMAPLRLADRLRFGDSAKARVPLLIIGDGVPSGAIDDRLFQQSDLLRMLDRAMHPGVPLSPFSVWIEHYTPVYGLVSNASAIEVFAESDEERGAYRATMRGPEVIWAERPRSVIAVERALHRQRALQQKARLDGLSSRAITLGRTMTQAGDSAGVLLGVSADVNPSRDPDDARSGLVLRRVNSYTPASIRPFLPTQGGYTLTARAFLVAPEEGDYWFSMFSNGTACLAVAGDAVLGCRDGINEGVAYLTAGMHRFDLRLAHRGGPLDLHLNWLPPGAKTLSPLPAESLRPPDESR